MRRLYHNKRYSRLHEAEYDDDYDSRRERLRDIDDYDDEDFDEFDADFDDDSGEGVITTVCDNLGVDYAIKKDGRQIEIYISDMVWVIVDFDNRNAKIIDIRITLQEDMIQCKTNTKSAENTCDEITTAIMVIKEIKEKMR